MKGLFYGYKHNMTHLATAQLMTEADLVQLTTEADLVQHTLLQ